MPYRFSQCDGIQSGVFFTQKLRKKLKDWVWWGSLLYFPRTDLEDWVLWGSLLDFHVEKGGKPKDWVVIGAVYQIFTLRLRKTLKDWVVVILYEYKMYITCSQSSPTIKFTAPSANPSDVRPIPVRSNMFPQRLLTMGCVFMTVQIINYGSVISFNSFQSMEPYMAPISNLYFAGENHCVLDFAQLFYKCKDEYFI